MKNRIDKSSKTNWKTFHYRSSFGSKHFRLLCSIYSLEISWPVYISYLKKTTDIWRKFHFLSCLAHLTSRNNCLHVWSTCQMVPQLTALLSGPGTCSTCASEFILMVKKSVNQGMPVSLWFRGTPSAFYCLLKNKTPGLRLFYEILQTVKFLTTCTTT